MSEDKIVILVVGAVFVLGGLFFFTSPPRLRRKLDRLKREGAVAEAVVLSVEVAQFRGITTNEISVEYSDQDGNAIVFDRRPIGTRTLSEGSTVPVYYDPARPKRMVIDLDAVTSQPRKDQLRQYFSQVMAVLIIGVAIAAMLFVE